MKPLTSWLPPTRPVRRALASGLERLRDLVSWPYQRLRAGKRTPDLRERARATYQKGVMAGVRFLPWLDSIHGETTLMRAAYRQMWREPYVKGPLLTKVYAITALDWQVTPKDDKSPRDQKNAELVTHCLRRLPDGVKGLLERVVIPMLMDGYSLTEKVWELERDDPQWEKYAVLKACKSKDTESVELIGDEFRNVHLVRGLKYNQGTEWPIGDFLYAVHLPLFENPTGMSDLRACYRPAWLIDTASKLRSINLEKHSNPLLKGTYQHEEDKGTLEAALEQAKTGTWLTVPEGMLVDAFDISGRGQSDFDLAVKSLREEIAIAIMGAHLQMAEGQVSGGRGDTKAHQSVGELFQWALVSTAVEVVNRQLIPDVIGFNDPGAGLPTLTLGGVTDETLQKMGATDEILQRIGLKLSAKDAYKRYGRKPPESQEDTLAGGSAGFPTIATDSFGLPPSQDLGMDVGMFDDEEPYEEFAWQTGKRGGRYWLPEGKEDAPANRLYGKAALKAAAAGRLGTIREEGQQLGQPRVKDAVDRLGAAAEAAKRGHPKAAAAVKDAAEQVGKQVEALARPLDRDEVDTGDSAVRSVASSQPGRAGKALRVGWAVIKGALRLGGDVLAKVVKKVAPILAAGGTRVAVAFGRGVANVLRRIAPFAKRAVKAGLLYAGALLAASAIAMAPAVPFLAAPGVLTGLLAFLGAPVTTFIGFRRFLPRQIKKAQAAAYGYAEDDSWEEFGDVEEVARFAAGEWRQGKNARGETRMISPGGRMLTIEAYQRIRSRGQVATTPPARPIAPIQGRPGAFDRETGIAEQATLLRQLSPQEREVAFEVSRQAGLGFAKANAIENPQARAAALKVWADTMQEIEDRAPHLYHPTYLASLRTGRVALLRRARAAARLEASQPSVAGYLWRGVKRLVGRLTGLEKHAEDYDSFAWEDWKPQGQIMVSPGGRKLKRETWERLKSRAKGTAGPGDPTPLPGSVAPDTQAFIRNAPVAAQAPGVQVSNPQAAGFLGGIRGKIAQAKAKVAAAAQTKGGQRAIAKAKAATRFYKNQGKRVVQGVQALARGRLLTAGRELGGALGNLVGANPQFYYRAHRRLATTFPEWARAGGVRGAVLRAAAGATWAGYQALRLTIGPALGAIGYVMEHLGLEGVANTLTSKGIVNASLKGFLRMARGVRNWGDKTARLRDQRRELVKEKWGAATGVRNALDAADDARQALAKAETRKDVKATGKARTAVAARMDEARQAHAQLIGRKASLAAFDKVHANEFKKRRFDYQFAEAFTEGEPTLKDLVDDVRQQWAEQAAVDGVEAPTATDEQILAVLLYLTPLSDDALVLEENGLTPNESAPGVAGGPFDEFAWEDWKPGRNAKGAAVMTSPGGRVLSRETFDRLRRQQATKKPLTPAPETDAQRRARQIGIARTAGLDPREASRKMQAARGEADPERRRKALERLEARPIWEDRLLAKLGFHEDFADLSKWKQGRNAKGEPRMVSPGGRMLTLEAFQKLKGHRAPTSARPTGGDALPRTPDAVDHDRVLNAPTGRLRVDPARFQFKQNLDPKTGAGDELRGITTFNPEFAGVVSVWLDPADGETYVVNGHHRHELAQRTGHPNLAIRYVRARDAKEARAVGALVNIAEGRGTAVDAAKFLRDTGLAPADLEKRGVSLKGRVAADAAALVRLNDRLFDRVARGGLDPARALAVAKHLGDHGLQDRLFALVDKREATGKELSDRVVSEMAREMAATPTTRTTAATLWGNIESEESLFVPRNELKAHVRGELAREVGDFMAVASKRRARRVGAAGNVLDPERNRQIAEEALRVRNVFDQLVNSKGEISDALNTAAAGLVAAKSKGERDAVRRNALDAVRAAVFREAGVGGGRASPGGSGPPDRGEPNRAVAGPANPGGAGARPAGLTDLFGNPVRTTFVSRPVVQATLEDAAREAWTQRAEAHAQNLGGRVEQWDAGGRFRVGDQWYQVGAAEDDFPVRPTVKRHADFADLSKWKAGKNKAGEARMVSPGGRMLTMEAFQKLKGGRETAGPSRPPRPPLNARQDRVNQLLANVPPGAARRVEDVDLSRLPAGTTVRLGRSPEHLDEGGPFDQWRPPMTQVVVSVPKAAGITQDQRGYLQSLDLGRWRGEGDFLGASIPATAPRPAKKPAGRVSNNAPDPSKPTAALPGSPEKLAVMQARLRAKLPLHLPGDAQKPKAGPPATAPLLADVTRIKTLQSQLAALPLVPLDKRIRRRRDKIARELADLARAHNRLGDVDLRAGRPSPFTEAYTSDWQALAEKTPTDEVALAGRDGQRAAQLLGQAKWRGAAVLSYLTAKAVDRLYASGNPLDATRLFTPKERVQLANALAASTGTAELLGRQRVEALAAKAQPYAEFAEGDVLEPMAPEDAVDYFKSLTPKLQVDPERFGAERRRHAFTLAVATDDVILRRVQDTIRAGIEQGQPPANLTAAVQDVLDRAGVSHRNPQYAEMVVRTNLMDALTQGTTEQMMSLADDFPVWRYEGIRDGRQGKDHEPKFDRYFPVEVTFQEVRGERPFNCRCSPTPVHRDEWKELQERGARAETSW